MGAELALRLAGLGAIGVAIYAYMDSRGEVTGNYATLYTGRKYALLGLPGPTELALIGVSSMAFAREAASRFPKNAPQSGQGG
jgi:hypothetical protein